MRTFKRSHEPIVWSLFGAGGMVAAFVLPALILFSGILVPLGIVDGAALSYSRAQTFVSHWWGGLLLVGVISLSAWHAMHRIFHTMNDLRFGAPRLRFVLCYGFAGCVTVTAITLILFSE